MRNKRLLVIFINRRLLYLAILMLCIGIGVWLYEQPALWTSVPLGSLVSGRKVVIDPGHGGGDPGAKFNGLVEKQLNLDVALRLKKYLSRVGIYCIMIRETDRDYFAAGNSNATNKRRDLDYRIQTANHSRADLFLSIHANSFPQTIYRGAQTFYNKADPRSQRLAETIQAQLVNDLGPNRRKATPGDFLVLNFIKMPGVIIETGFLSNSEDAHLLATGSYREKLAGAIYQAVIKYFSIQAAE